MRKLFVALLFVSCATAQPSPTPAAPPPPPDAGTVAVAPPPPPEDPWLWLEEVEGEKSLAWVKERNATSTKELEADARFAPLRDRLKAIYDSKEKIPQPEVRGAFIYNFWRDDAHQRGLWRRTTLSEFKKKDPKWETVIDVDALGAAEKQSWVWKGAVCTVPKHERCMVMLSAGGSDAKVTREFDAVKKTFVAGGFELPAAKSNVAWKNADTLLVATDFGEGSLTKAGYPRLVKEWKRGTKLTDAKLVFEGEETDVGVWVVHELDHGKVRDWIQRAPSFFTDESFLLEGDRPVKLDKPDDASISVWNDQALVQLRSDWVINEKIFKAGSLLVTPLADLRAGKHDFVALFEPQPNTALESFAGTKSALLIKTLEDVKGVVSVAWKGKKGWEQHRLELQPASNAFLAAYDSEVNDDFFMWEESFISPSTLSLGTLKAGVEPAKWPRRELLKSQPAYFKADGLEVTQHFATSKDGTKVPWFLVSKKGAPLDGTTPTLLYGYGGFEVSLVPEYDASTGAAWLERGGAYAVANIRGGGEYGPDWHQAALRHDRQRAYDDFSAVAADLVASKVTVPAKLGIMGGSNGGLLMGVMLTQHPEQFGAIVCEVPLLDMKRYHLLLAGASWMEEYGDPGKPDDWAALKLYSPYQNVRPGTKYPRTLFTTSTRDDRVHPGHARKMVARLLEQKADVLYFENTEGGHAGAADSTQRARLTSLAFTFLARQLGLP